MLAGPDEEVRDLPGGGALTLRLRDQILANLEFDVVDVTAGAVPRLSGSCWEHV
jgi:hypothetical protein